LRKVYGFHEGGIGLEYLLGGKGAGLAEMSRLGIPVPPGFIITTDAWKEYYNTKKLSDSLKAEISENINKLEKTTGKKFGGHPPLLVSVRSGAPVSMPGMLDTVLNLGLNDVTVENLAHETKDARFSYDCYRRFISCFGRIVLGIQKEKFDNILEAYKSKLGVQRDSELDIDALKEIVNEYKILIERETGRKFPEDVYEQLFLAVKAVFDSWFNPRAVAYRRANKIPEDLGTAVSVQAMVFGNMGNDSGTGVMFTRNPSTGEKKLYGEFLVNAQGEDLVSGVRTPQPLDYLREKFPKIYDELISIAEKLERHLKDMQDVEFTVERGKLYILQTRSGKRNALAAAKIAFDMYKEGIITKEEAIKRITEVSSQEITIQQRDPTVKVDILARGLPASPGLVTGKVVFNSDEAVTAKEKGEKVILVRPETSPEDIQGIMAAEGVLTCRGGLTSHAAIVTRSLNKPCIVGCEAIKIDLEAEECCVEKGGVTVRIKKGDIITIDGTTGEVIMGEVPTVAQKLSEYLTVLHKELR